MNKNNYKLNLTLMALIIVGCDDLTKDYQSNEKYPLAIDNTICEILNEKESTTAITFTPDSLSMIAIYDSLITDTVSFAVLSNSNNWKIPVDSLTYFMVYAPQTADSYYVALNSSSEFGLFSASGEKEIPDTTSSMVNIAGCSDIRVRYAYSSLNGVYLARLVNSNVSSVKMVFMNSNSIPAAGFSVSSVSAAIGDTLTFSESSSSGSYPILIYSWDFDDGTSSDDSSIVEHVYSDSGSFSPSLTVSDGYLSHSVTQSSLITISGGSEE
jgi:PKD repeat protein